MIATVGSHRHTSRRCPRRRAGLLAAALASAAVLAAACGSGGASPAASASSHLQGYQQYRAYTACMRSNGAPFWPEPSPVVDQGVWDDPLTYQVTPQILAAEHGPGWQAALTVCQRLAPRHLPFTAAQVAALRSQLLKLAACMRAHGISHFPSPSAGPYGAGFASPGPGVNPDAAGFLAAQRACWRYAPPS